MIWFGTGVTPEAGGLITLPHPSPAGTVWARRGVLGNAFGDRSGQLANTFKSLLVYWIKYNYYCARGK